MDYTHISDVFVVFTSTLLKNWMIERQKQGWLFFYLTESKITLKWKFDTFIIIVYLEILL